MPSQPTQHKRYANELVIRLRSDLCPGSGEGFLSGVDSDVFHDQRGIPQIPGRRLKGCLRQAARDIFVDPALVKLLFGTPGSSESGLLTVMDATLDIPTSMQVPSDPADALDMLTYTRAQTKLDPATGTVADGTLRYTRVVRHYLPTLDKDEPFAEATFHARLELRDSPTAPNEEMRAAMCRIARALKNVGLNRNRGLGAVACKLQDETTWQPIGNGANATALTHACCFTERHKDAMRDMVAISYVVHLDGPVMLPQQNAGRSQGYIPGTSVQGFFASHLSSALQDRFNDVLLGDKVRFSPLYPMDKDGHRCLPAPPFVVRLKGGAHDGYHWNGLFIKAPTEAHDDESRTAWSPSDSDRILRLTEGTSFKPGKGGFVGSDWLPVSVRRTIAYHHSTGETTGDEGTLYMQECLCEDQLFGGFVECTPELAPTLLEALESGVIYFGRSKSAQYGRCRLVACDGDLSGREDGKPQTLQEGAPYAFLLESDAALLDSACATYTADAHALCTELFEASAYKLAPEALLVQATSLGRKTSGGYNAKWNQKRPQSQVITCGSAISFVAESAATVPSVFTIGERQAEGYGRIRLVRLDAVSTPSLEEQQAQSHESPEESLAEQCRVATLEYARNNARRLSELTASFVGRLSLMVRQSTSLDDLTTRIDSITDEARHEHATDLVSSVVDMLRSKTESDEPEWSLAQQCLLLLFRFAKYNGKLSPQERDAQ